jgi:predicted DNA-binding protein with PD1-like motif
MTPQPIVSDLTSHVFRLSPGQDLKKELLQYAQLHKLQAAAVLSSVGSLSVCHLRLAGAKEVRVLKGPFEIVSLTGTLSHEALHMHISVSDQEGRVFGGHLMDGSLIETTAEIALLEHVNLIFKRELDKTTGYKELIIKARN